MDDFISVAHISELPPGTMKTVYARGKKFALANIEGEFFAVDDTCSHEQCSLGSEGFLDGNVVVCGCHGSSFDMMTGKVLSLPAPSDVAAFQVKVENDHIWIKL